MDWRCVLGGHCTTTLTSYDNGILHIVFSINFSISLFYNDRLEDGEGWLVVSNGHKSCQGWEAGAGAETSGDIYN